jgi:hypothetical protein
MRNITILVVSILSAFMTYALFSGLIALIFCITYKEVAQFPATIVFIGLFSFCTSMFVADSLHNSDGF